MTLQSKNAIVLLSIPQVPINFGKNVNNSDAGQFLLLSGTMSSKKFTPPPQKKKTPRGGNKRESSITIMSTSFALKF